MSGQIKQVELCVQEEEADADGKSMASPQAQPARLG